MIFKVLPNGQNPPKDSKSTGFLLTDNWDDWFKYSTLYYFIFFDESGEEHSIGGVKIGQFNMEEGQRRPNLPPSFEKLDDAFFSLGQDESYYKSLNEMPPEIRDRILSALRDVAIDKELFEKALNEDVTGVSLLREVTKSTVLGQFNRIAKGGARLSRYDFSYTAPKKLKIDPEPITNRRAFNRLLPTNTGPCGRFVTGNKSIKCVNWKFIFAKKPAMGIV